MPALLLILWRLFNNTRYRVRYISNKRTTNGLRFNQILLLFFRLLCYRFDSLASDDNSKSFFLLFEFDVKKIVCTNHPVWFRFNWTQSHIDGFFIHFINLHEDFDTRQPRRQKGINKIIKHWYFVALSSKKRKNNIYNQ